MTGAAPARSPATTFLEANGLSLRAERCGSGGPTLVLIHELGGALDSFDAMMPALAAFGTLRYDQRGAGLSEKPRRPFTLGDHADDLRALLDAFGLARPVHLVGVAAGAAIALAFYAACPDRVASLSLCAPALTVPPERQAYLRDRSERAVREGMRAIVADSLARSYPEHLRGDGIAFAVYRARFLANDPVAYGFANGALADARLDEAIRAVAVPCEVLAGRHDLLRPPAATRQIADAIGHATFHIVESGHIMPVQAPAAMAGLVRAFVEGIAGAAPTGAVN